MWAHTSGSFSRLAPAAVVKNTTVIVCLSADLDLLE